MENHRTIIFLKVVILSGYKRCNTWTANPKRVVTRSTCRTSLCYPASCVSVGKWWNNSEYRNSEVAISFFDVSINTLLGSPRQLICQCCSMPLDDSTISKEPSGSFNEEYCKWCYSDGKFTYSNMDDLINFCVDHMANENWPSDQVRAYLTDMLPKLNYWKHLTKWKLNHKHKPE